MYAVYVSLYGHSATQGQRRLTEQITEKCPQKVTFLLLVQRSPPSPGTVLGWKPREQEQNCSKQITTAPGG